MIGYAHETRVLERLRFGLQARVSREFLIDTHLSASADMITGDMAVTLSKELLADRFLDDVAQVPVHGRMPTTDTPRSALVELPRTWWARLLRRRARAVWCPVVGDAVITNGADDVPVTGVATVRADYFRTFPEAVIAYPHELGPVRVLVRTGDPYDWTPRVGTGGRP